MWVSAAKRLLPSKEFGFFETLREFRELRWLTPHIDFPLRTRLGFF